MNQLNVRVPKRLFEEIDLLCQLNHYKQREFVCAALIRTVELERKKLSLPPIPRETLLIDAPKPTEGTP